MVKWTHITITVADTERSSAFYSRYCALKVVRDRRLEGGATVWLGPEPVPGQEPLFVLVLDPGQVTDKLDHLGFQCASKEAVDEIAALAKQEGLLLEVPKDSGGSVGYWALISDPDGHKVEFTFGQPLKGL